MPADREAQMSFREEKERIVYLNEEGRELAVIEFPMFEEGKAEVTHTIVDKSLRGRGIAGQLTMRMAEKFRREGIKAELTCSYAVSWFSKHPEYRDLLIDPEKEEEKAAGQSGGACRIPVHRRKS